MEATSDRFIERAWVDKLAAGFTVSGGLSGDKNQTLSDLSTMALQHGMIWVGMGINQFNADGGNRLSIYAGATECGLQEPVEEAPIVEDLRSGRHLGERVATLAGKLSF